MNLASQGFYAESYVSSGEIRLSFQRPSVFCCSRRGLKLRVNPDTLTRLARSLSGTGPAGVAEAIDLMEEAMRRFPDNARVLWLYGIMSSHLYSGRDRAPPGR